MQNENAIPLWMLKGLLWGGFMFLVMEIAMPLANGNQMHIGIILLKLILWLVTGLAYGYTFNLVEKRKS